MTSGALIFLPRWAGVGKHARTIKKLGDVLGIVGAIVSEMLGCQSYW
jgi:hypothetical protein